MAISDVEMQELRTEFEADLDAYMAEWESSLRDKFAEDSTSFAEVPDVRQRND